MMIEVEIRVAIRWYSIIKDGLEVGLGTEQVSTCVTADANPQRTHIVVLIYRLDVELPHSMNDVLC